VNGELNAAYNCVDRHVEAGHGDRIAIHFVGEPGDRRDISYAELQREVSKCANALVSLGISTGDRVAIYLPMIAEAVIAMLACARIGAPHSVVFGGFSADALRSRIDDAQARLVITADGGFRRGAASALKPAVDEPVAGDSPVRTVLVVLRTKERVAWHDQRDVWWHDVVDTASAEQVAAPHDAEHPLFILYTSGTTGKPKGIFHTTGGYLTQTVYTHKYVFDLHAAVQRSNPGHLRGHAGHAAPGTLVGDHRRVRRQHSLHRANGNQDVHEVGRADPG
jgi:acetyl-CoA synthetase